jgi:DNA-binding MarR family transcriptional regulator
VPHVSTSPPYLFGDLLALARQSWVRQMGSRLEQLGYGDYRRSDAAVMRVLIRGAAPIGKLGLVLGVSRQAARKIADGLIQRRFAATERDAHDARKTNVVLTPAGQAYAAAVLETIDALNRELGAQLDPEQLRVVDAVLRTALADDDERRRAARLVRPPA